MATNDNTSIVYHRYTGLINEESPDSWFSNDSCNDRLADCRFIINLINELSNIVIIISSRTKSIS